MRAPRDGVDVPRRRGVFREAEERVPLKRYIVVGGEAELALLLHIFPEGVEELDGAFAIYADEPPIGFDVVEGEDVAEGWEDSWRAFHHGVQVGSFWIGPPWEDAPRDAATVVVDPGRAFGTGAHATTRLCVVALEQLERSSLLDVGCGSGVLSIAAAKLGFAPIVAVDVDAVAIEATQANARANGVGFHALVLDALAEAPPPADVAVANIALDVVEALGARLECDRFLTSGYLESDQPALPRFEHVGRRTLEGWAADVWRSA